MSARHVLNAKRGKEMDTTGLAFPLKVDDLGQIAAQTGDEGIRARIVQVLLTSPGERVHLPEFGCGLRDLVFDPNNHILLAAAEFTVNAALQRWLGGEIIVEGVDIRNNEAEGVDNPSAEAELQIEIAYVRRDQLERGKVKIVF